MLPKKSSKMVTLFTHIHGNFQKIKRRETHFAHVLICMSTSKFTVYIQETKTKKTNVFVSYCSSRLSKHKRESEIGRRGNPIQHLPHQPVHVLFSKLRTRRSGDWRGNAEK